MESYKNMSVVYSCVGFDLPNSFHYINQTVENLCVLGNIKRVTYCKSNESR